MWKCIVGVSTEEGVVVAGGNITFLVREEEVVQHPKCKSRAWGCERSRIIAHVKQLSVLPAAIGTRAEYHPDLMDSTAIDNNEHARVVGDLEGAIDGTIGDVHEWKFRDGNYAWTMMLRMTVPLVFILILPLLRVVVSW